MAQFQFERAIGALLLLITVVLSLLLIKAPGTTDVSLVLGWADILYRDGFIPGYSNIIIERHTEYPPLSHALLYSTRSLGAFAGLSPLVAFKISIVVFQLAATGIMLLLSRSYWIAAAFNASILLSAVGLGYQDVWFAPPLIMAYWAFEKRHNVLGTVLFATACLVKWQPLIVAPFIGIYLFEISNFRSCLDAVKRRRFWQPTVAVVLIIAMLGLLFGIAPAVSLWNGMNHPYWSGQALNLAWALEFVRALLVAPQDELTVWLPPGIYLLPLKIVFWIAFGTIVVRAIRSDKTFRNCLLFSIGGLVTYATLNAGVHENHLFAAVILAYLLMLHEDSREHRTIVTILAVMLNVNMFIFYGITGTQVQSTVLGVDLSGVLAILYVVAWLLLVIYIRDATRPANPRLPAFSTAPAQR